MASARPYHGHYPLSLAIIHSESGVVNTSIRSSNFSTRERTSSRSRRKAISFPLHRAVALGVFLGLRLELLDLLFESALLRLRSLEELNRLQKFFFQPFELIVWYPSCAPLC